MKLLFYQYGLQAGGAERTVSLLANYAVQQGDEAIILLMDNQPPFYTLDRRVRLFHLNVAHCSRNKWDAIKNNFRTICHLKRSLQNFDPDVIISFSAKPSAIFHAWLAKRRDCPLIGSERANPRQRPKNIWYSFGPWLSTKCSGFLFQTAGAQSCFPQKTQKRSIILQNMVDPREFEQADTPWAFRNGICAVGRMDTGKCFDDLLRAFSIALKKFPDAHLDLYGDGPERKSLEHLADTLGLGSAITFCGRSQQIISEYAKHKLFIMTSQSEGMPCVLIEALASGCACISTNCDFGPSDLIRDGENGFLVPVHDINATADRLCRLLEDDQLSRRLSETAKGIRKTNNVENLGETFRTYVQQVINASK